MDVVAITGNYFDEQERRKVEQQAVKRLEGLGYTVTLQATRIMGLTEEVEAVFKKV